MQAHRGRSQGAKLAIAQYCQDLQPWGRCGSVGRHWDVLPAFSDWHARTMCCRRGAGFLVARRHSMRGWTCSCPFLASCRCQTGDSTAGLMSPAIMFCAASRGFHSSHSVLLSANWSFCLIGVLIGVGARDFLCSTVAFGPDIFLFRRTSSGEQNIARSRGRPQQLRVQPSAAATSAVLGVLSPTVLTDAVWL